MAKKSGTRAMEKREYSLTPKGYRVWNQVGLSSRKSVLDNDIPWSMLYYLHNDGPHTKRQLHSKVAAAFLADDEVSHPHTQGWSKRLDDAAFERWFRYVKKVGWIRPGRYHMHQESELTQRQKRQTREIRERI